MWDSWDGDEEAGMGRGVGRRRHDSIDEAEFELDVQARVEQNAAAYARDPCPDIGFPLVSRSLSPVTNIVNLFMNVLTRRALFVQVACTSTSIEFQLCSCYRAHLHHLPVLIGHATLS